MNEFDIAESLINYYSLDNKYFNIVINNLQDIRKQGSKTSKVQLNMTDIDFVEEEKMPYQQKTCYLCSNSL